MNPVNEVDRALMSHDAILQQLKCNLRATINRKILVADLKRRELSPITSDDDIIMEPETIMYTQWLKRDSTFIEESLYSGRIYQRMIPPGKMEKSCELDLSI